MDIASTPYQLSSYYFSSSNFCWYRFYPSSSSISSIKIEVNSLTNAQAEVYLEGTTNSFSYITSLSSGGSKTVTLAGSYDPVWVLVTPTSSSAYISLTGTGYTSSSSYSTSTVDSSMILIIVFSIVGFCLLFALTGLMIFLRIRRQRMYMATLAMNSNAQAAVNVAQPSPYNQYAGYRKLFGFSQFCSGLHHKGFSFWWKVVMKVWILETVFDHYEILILYYELFRRI